MFPLRRSLLPLLGVLGLAGSCLPTQTAGHRPGLAGAVATIQTSKFELIDSSRHRPVPVVAYFAGASHTPPAGLRVALLNHGYGVRNTDYSFLARNLAAHGYYVASLQQTLPHDQPLPTTGDVYQTRYPYWAQGVQTMVFVLRALHQRYPALSGQPALLVGHSFGGDMAMLFAREHPELAQKVISLDNCRMPFPRTRQPALYSLRSSDQLPDPGVLPTLAEQQQFGITVVQLPATPHNAMSDKATAAQKQEMNAWITQFIAAP